MPPVFIYNMPAVNPNNPSQGGPQRTTFRPPWVKEGPTPLPMPAAPWTARSREAVAAVSDEPNKVEKPGPRKLSKVTIIPSQPTDNNAQEVISQSNLKWNPKVPEKKQETHDPFSKPQAPQSAEKKKEPIVPLSKLQPQVASEKKQEKPVEISKPHSPLVIEKKQEATVPIPKPQLPITNKKKQEAPVPLNKPKPSLFIEKKQELPVPLSKPSSKLSPVVTEKEGTGQSTGPNLRDTQRKDSTIITPVVEPSKRKESTDKVIPVVLESSKRKESTDKVIPVVLESSKRKESTDKVIPVVLESSKRKESTDKFFPAKIESPKRKESTDKVIPVVVESSAPQERRKESIVQLKREPEKETPKASREFAKPIPKPVEKEVPKSILKEPSKASIPSAPKPPPAPPMAPPLPPPPPGKGAPVIKSELTQAKAAKLDALRSRPRRRPDWTDMMKEVESGKQLRHVHCNDRSAPILPQEKAKGQFVYESEKGTHDPHKQLLTQIQKGVKLKRVKCNDRSKPLLDGLRKFRRQMTIEEQIQKSMSMADVVAAAAEPDELDDIDKVRDDLQSTKQMLALELRNKEALERENKRLMARLLNLEVELEKEKNSSKADTDKGPVTQGRSPADEKLVQQLKEEAAEASRVVKEMEDKYHCTAEELDATRAKLESAWLRNQQLELEVKAGSRGNAPITKQPSSKKLAASMASMPNGKTVLVSDDESEYTEETETETESDEEGNEEDAAAVQERRLARELKLLATKLRSYKEKQAIALKERHSLREQLRKQQKLLRQEKKKYKALQKEVDKMAKLMKDDEEEMEEEEEKTEEEVTETESESESEESEDDELTDGDLPDDASVDDKRKNLTNRSKHHENRLGTLKKGNYLLKANIDRLQDDINRQREMSLSLQEDLNSVLAELG